MRVLLAGLILLFLRPLAGALVADDLASKCPGPSKEAQASCKEITYSDLPKEATTLLTKMKCDVGPGSNYDYGSAVDLNGDGSPEYQFCCHEAPHGPCGSVLISKVGTEWKDLTAKEGMLGFEGACNLFVVLESQRAGFHDICLPDQCSPTTPKTCVPTIWQYDSGRYRATGAAPVKSANASGQSTPRRPARKPQ